MSLGDFVATLIHSAHKMESPESLEYKIAISLIPGIGAVTARNLIAYVGSVEGVFQEKEKNLLKIPGVGEVNAKRIIRQNVLERAKENSISFKKTGFKRFSISTKTTLPDLKTAAMHL